MNGIACQECGKTVTRATSFDMGDGRWFCPDCFVAKAQERRDLSGRDRERLKEEVKREAAGLVPRKLLKEVVEAGYERIIVQGGDYDEESNRAVNEIERVCYLAMSREMLSVLSGLRSVIEEIEEDLREKIRKASGLMGA